MREVASFMQMYPAYTLRDVLAEKAITYFSLLNEGFRVRARHYQTLAQISDLPHLEPNKRKEIYDEFKWATTVPSDILKTDSKGSSEAEIRKALGG